MMLATAIPQIPHFGLYILAHLEFGASKVNRPALNHLRRAFSCLHHSGPVFGSDCLPSFNTGKLGRLRAAPFLPCLMFSTFNQEDNIMLFYRIPDAVRESGISRSGLYALLSEGKISARKHGRRLLIEGASLRAYLENLPAATFRAPPAKAAA